jgi:hypothetical protein
MNVQQQIVDTLKPGAWMKKAELAAAIGVEADNLTYHLGAPIKEGEIVATGSTSTRAFALSGTEPGQSETKLTKRETKAAKKKPAAGFKFKLDAPDPKLSSIELALVALYRQKEKIDIAIAAMKALA